MAAEIAALQHDREVAWRPNPGPQSWLIACPVFEVLYGGARGGGKTAGMLGEWLNHAQQWGGDATGLVVRRERVQLMEMIEESKRLYYRLGAEWNETDKLWRMSNGARLRFAYLENDADAEAYQGHAYTRVYVEELSNFPRPEPVLKLMATLRSAKGVPCGFRATANPGGPGHLWVKQRYIDPWPAGLKVLQTEYENPFTGKKVVRDRVFIPALLRDNPHLPDEYVANLQMQGSAELVRAWLHGDWSVIQGAFFSEWRTDLHVVQPMELPREWVRYRAADWGSAAPFAVYWIAVSDGSLPQFPRGALVVYREWYGIAKTKSGEWKPNVGLKLTAEDVAKGILEREEPNERIDFGVMDPAAFANHGGPSIGERMGALGVQFHRADNTRVGPRGAMSGWDQVRARLKGDDDTLPDGHGGAADQGASVGQGRPMLYFFSTCVHAIRTIPALQHDIMRPEDVDTDGEDHAGDAIRYGCLARPWVRASTKAERPQPLRGRESMTINEIIKARTKARLEAEG